MKAKNLRIISRSLSQQVYNLFSIYTIYQLLLSLDNNYDGHDEFDAQTEYERNFRNQGVAIHRVIVEKKEDKNV